QTMRDLKVNGFVGTPTFLMTVIKRAEELGYSLRRDFALQRAWFTGEMVPASLRKTFEGEYGIDTYQTYAVTEPGGAIAYECPQKSGMHLSDDYVVEIVDPETGKQLRHGQVGELVVTPIHNQTWGLIRFGTGDLSSYTTEPCPCGRTAHRLNGIFGRSSDAVKVRGMFVVTKQAEGAIMSFEPVSRFQITVGRREHRDEITLRAELKGEAVDRMRLAEDLNRKFQDVCRIKLDGIEFVPQGTIPAEHQPVVDERTWE
ncbi:MAG: AMP-binding protein, partial [Chloroflexota bacterium]